MIEDRAAAGRKEEILGIKNPEFPNKEGFLFLHLNMGLSELGIYNASEF